jgi:flagellar hook-length control protein FliK
VAKKAEVALKGGPKRSGGTTPGAKVAEGAVKTSGKSRSESFEFKPAEPVAGPSKDNGILTISEVGRHRGEVTRTTGLEAKPSARTPGTPFSEMAGKVGSQIIRSITYLAGGDSKEMLVRLEPPELGRLQLRMALADGELSARMVVENKAVKELVESQLPQLRQGLQDQGFQVDKLLVETRSEDGGNSAFKQGRNESTGPDKQGQAAESLTEVEPVTDPQELRRSGRTDGGRIDYLA